MWTPAGNTYFCENARGKLCEAMPAEVSEIWTSPCGNAVQVLLGNVWSDVVGYCMRQTRQEPLMPGDNIGVQVFWQHLPLEQKATIEEFVSLKIVELNEQSTLTSDLARACAQLFHPSEKDLVGRLCVQLGYIDAEDQASLGVIRNNVDRDPLELFRSSKSNPQRSRYETLFVEDDNESSSLRQLFFRNTVHNTGGDQGHMLLHTLQTVVDSSFVSNREEQAAILQEVLVAVQHVYCQVRLPNYPNTLTEDMAWSTMRHAWADEQYWLSVEELYSLVVTSAPSSRFIGIALKQMVPLCSKLSIVDRCLL